MRGGPRWVFRSGAEWEFLELFRSMMRWTAAWIIHYGHDVAIMACLLWAQMKV
jgi:hypothetical protein